MERVGYIFFRLLQVLVGIIPFRVLYAIADIFAFILQFVVRYRRETVLNNLRRSFPLKSNKELNQIMRKFYRHLCDILLESVKGYSFSVEELNKRYRCINPEVSNRYFEKGQSVIFALSHYANWEWGTQIAGNVFLHDTISFYKPLSNRYIDKYIRDQRESRGMLLCSIYQTKFIFRSEDRIPRAYFLVSDQSPSNKRNAYWTQFLNQDTACLRGVESYARMFDLPVIYLDIKRVERGYYTVFLDVLCDRPKDTLSGEITELYMKELEEIIVDKPEDWLWSHKRWKKKRPINSLSDFRSSCYNAI